MQTTIIEPDVRMLDSLEISGDGSGSSLRNAIILLLILIVFTGHCPAKLAAVEILHTDTTEVETQFSNILSFTCTSERKCVCSLDDCRDETVIQNVLKDAMTRFRAGDYLDRKWGRCICMGESPDIHVCDRLCLLKHFLDSIEFNEENIAEIKAFSAGGYNMEPQGQVLSLNNAQIKIVVHTIQEHRQESIPCACGTTWLQFQIQLKNGNTIRLTRNGCNGMLLSDGKSVQYARFMNEYKTQSRLEQGLREIENQFHTIRH